MRISDWSSDVCSSDLPPGYAASPLRKGASVVQRLTNPSCVAPCLPPPSHRQQLGLDLRQRLRAVGNLLTLGPPVFSYFLRILRPKLQAQAVVIAEMGRASCRERVCQYGCNWVGGVVSKKK